MARKDRKAPKEDKVDRARKRIWGARERLQRSLLGPLLGSVRIEWCEGKASDPLLACVDPEQGVIWVNPHRRPELGEPAFSGRHCRRLSSVDTVYQSSIANPQEQTY